MRLAVCRSKCITGLHAGAKPAGAWSLVAAALLGAAASADAFTVDARRMAMGSVMTPGGGEMASANVAYQAMPERPDGRGFVLPIPLGLAQFAADMPTFDPENNNFDVMRLVNLALRPPFFMELSEPSALDGDINIRLARNEFAIDFQDAHELLSQEPVRAGALYSRSVMGLGLRGVQANVSPWMEVEGRVAFDNALYGVVAGGQALQPNSVYGLDATGATAGGASVNLGTTRGGWGARNPQAGDGLYLGGFGKYLMGFGFGAAETHVGLASGDTIFGASDPLDVRYDGMTRYANLGQMGNGFGVDLGMAYRTGGLDLGLGVRNLGAQVTWSRTTLEHTYLDPATNEMITETLAENAPYTVRLPAQTACNVSWTGRRTVLAADVTTSRWATLVHLGAERVLGPLALRGGLHTDERHMFQYSGGIGLGLGPVWLDLALQTHGYAVTTERGLTFGTSLALR
jgi:hypothetical protein